MRGEGAIKSLTRRIRTALSKYILVLGKPDMKKFEKAKKSTIDACQAYAKQVSFDSNV